jgi:hypothetical protein
MALASRSVPVRVVIAALLVGVAAALGPAAAGQDPAAAAGQRFLAHLEANQPIAGEFRIETVLDEDQQRGLIRDLPSEKKGKSRLKTSFEPSRQTLVCRWAWATDREVCEALPDSSKDSMYGFLRLPEGNLVGLNKKQFNLTKPEMLRDEMNRPALFYFFAGGGHWNKVLEGAEFSLATPNDAPADSLTLVARKGPSQVVLVLERNTSRIRRASLYSGDRLSWSLDVEELAKSPTDDRVFPSRASVAVYWRNSAQPMRKVELTANRIDFPTAAEVASQFKLPVPAGALIGDRVLKSGIELKEPIDGADLITGRVNPPRRPYANQPSETLAPSGEGQSRSRVYLFVLLVAVPLVLFGLYVFVTRVWPGRRQVGTPGVGSE